MGLEKFEDILKNLFPGIGLGQMNSSGRQAASSMLSARQAAAVKAAEEKLREAGASSGVPVPAIRELWWSGKMREVLDSGYGRNPAMRSKGNWALLADGRAVQYVCCTEAGKGHGLAWDDAVHIGTGFVLGCFASLWEAQWAVERLKESPGYAMMENLWLASQCGESPAPPAEPKRKSSI